jgi:hypothetical protein
MEGVVNNLGKLIGLNELVCSSKEIGGLGVYVMCVLLIMHC